MTGLVYLFPPLTGLIAYFTSGNARTRWHGLQSVVLGFLWPAGLYAGALISATATQVAGALGASAWLTFVIGTGIGRDLSIPYLGPVLRLWAAESPRT